ncbi:MAG: DNA-directed RNA polymerase subunit H [Candidatus Nitrosocaldus sp.]|nr:DNA-directed RNA polymerase subunit H [Candidatus Nitrosocaldus sp.]MDW8274753.1 DNA-directed RNA polymerase subunit H [Candidatus Nitrosocaldus sp.]
MSDRVIRHEYVPEHILLSKEEAEEVLRRYHVRPNQLPFILASDPAIRGIGAKPGDIVKIIRKSPTAGVSIYYRYVIEG